MTSASPEPGPAGKRPRRRKTVGTLKQMIGLAAVALVADVVDVAGAGGAVAAAGPNTVLVAEGDGAADGRGDGAGPALICVLYL